MGELDFKTAFRPLKKEIDDYAYFGCFIRKSLTDETIIGIQARANIFVKKQLIRERIEQEIEKQQLPFVISDWFDSSPSFQILLRNDNR